MEGLEAGRPEVIYEKTANWSEIAGLMLQARGYETHVMEGGSEAWVAQGLHHPRRPARPASHDPPTNR
jgi:3-mercaptopyruvate sulfurtransferase SseA